MLVKLRSFFIVGLAGTLLFTTACTGNNNAVSPPKTAEGNQTPARSMQLQSNAGSTNLLSQNDAVISLVSHANQSYVPVDRLAEILEYTAEWNEAAQTFYIGDTDVVYEIKANSTQALKEEDPIQLSSVPVLINGSLHIPVAAVAVLFQEDMDYDIADSKLIVHPSNPIGTDIPDMDEDAVVEEELDFADDPADPFKQDLEEGNTGIEEEDPGEEAETADDEAVWSSNDEQIVPAASVKNINMNSMIHTARQYLGVKYKFGTSSYSKSKRFDCSSYTKYIFGKYGVSLKRTARYQARKGTNVSRKSLRKGDLLFFYVPGRFRTNKTVGHVGIYIGNRRMIHSSPEPKNGVQITNINKAYWKETFLKAKRVAY